MNTLLQVSCQILTFSLWNCCCCPWACACAWTWVWPWQKYHTPSWKTAFFDQINLYKVDYSYKTDETTLQSNCKFSFRPIHNKSKEETWVLTHLVMCWRCILYMRMGLWILRLHSEERADSWVSHLHTSSYSMNSLGEVFKHNKNKARWLEWTQYFMSKMCRNSFEWNSLYIWLIVLCNNKLLICSAFITFVLLLNGTKENRKCLP